MVEITTEKFSDFVGGMVHLPMKFDVQLNDEDYVAFQTSLLSQGVTRQSLLIKLIVSLLLIIALCALLYFFNVPKIGIAVFFILAFAGRLYGFFYFHRLLENKIRKHLQVLKSQGGAMPYEEQFTIEFLQEEFRGDLSRGTLTFQYSDIVNIFQDDTHIFIAFNDVQGVILPVQYLDGKESELLLWLSNQLIDNFARQEIENNA